MPEEEEYDYSEGEQPDYSSDPGVQAIKSAEKASYSPNFSPSANDSNLVQFPGSNNSSPSHEEAQANGSNPQANDSNLIKFPGSNNSNSNSPLRNGENSIKSPTGSGTGAGFTNGGFNQNNLSAAESATPSETYGGKGFTNAVSGKNSPATKSKGKAKGFLKGPLKKFGPIGAVVALIAAVAGFSFFGQSSQLLSYTELIKERYGSSLGLVQDRRSKAWMKMTIDPDNRDPVANITKKSKIFSTEKFKINPFQKKKLKAAGIEIKGKYIEFEGQLYAAGPKSAQKSGYPDINDAVAQNKKLRDTMSKATMTWRQKATGWLSGHIEKVLNRMVEGMRGKWRGFDAGSDDADANFKSTLETEFKGKGLGAIVDDAEHEADMTKNADGDEVPDLHDSGKPKTTNGRKKGGFKSFFVGPDADAGDIKGALKGIADSPFSKVTGFVTAGVNLTCASMQMVGTISLAVAGAQAVQIITLATNLFEAVDKMKAGDGDASPYANYNNAAAKPKTTVYEETDSGSIVVETKNGYVESDPDASNSNELKNVSSSTKQTTVTESFMDSEATRSLYEDTTPNPNDPAIKSMNPQSVLGNITNIFGKVGGIFAGVSLSLSAFRTCTVAKLIASVVDSILDAIPGAKILKWIADAAAGAAISFGIQLAISLVVEAFLPFVMKMLTRNFLAGDFGGGESGAAVLGGAEMVFSDVDQNVGLMLSTPKSALAFRNEEKKYIAENAEFERNNHSPFDASSPHTFLGSLSVKLTPLRSKLNSFTDATSNISSLAMTSLKSLLPNASATETANEISELVEYTKQNCTSLYEIGGLVKKSGIGCVPHRSADFSTMDLDPATVIDKISDNFDDTNEEEFVIKDGSRYANWADACLTTERKAWGYPNFDYAGNLSLTSGAGTVGNAAIGSVPVLGGILDAADQTIILENFDYVGGPGCFNGYQNEGEDYVDEDGTKKRVEGLSSKVASWNNEAKLFAQSSIDFHQAVLEGYMEEHPVQAYLNRKYEKNPPDNSYEGIIARYAGLSKEDVKTVFAFMKVQKFIAEYEPAGLAPTPQEMSDEEQELVLPASEEDHHPIIGTLLSPFREERYLRNFAS